MDKYIDYDRIYRTYGELGFPHARSVNEWKQFLGSLWESNKERFIVSNAYLGQHFTKKSLEEDGFDKIIKAFNS